MDSKWRILATKSGTGKQYKYQKRVLELPIEVRKEQKIQQMKEELEVVKNI
ncbi:hypothetical protein IV80_GL001545 [Pediococcus cellicola]|uniref:Uncharacterized protein n=2 Tax=Pediococcus cellicola TaxID=319652 RepID=A0A0R2IWE1_9LACO|nr:hypothetical protein IV80_GL001545 [Pediococcus cellicola]